MTNGLKEHILKPDSPDAPWWVRFAYVFGLPGLIAIFLIWFVTSKVDVSLTEIKNVVIAHDKATNDHEKETIIQNRQIIQLLQDTNKTLEATCVNAAKTNMERKDCLK